MLNYATISEAIAQKLTKANNRVDYYDALTEASTRKVIEAESNTSITDKEYDAICENHNKLMEKYESAVYIRNELKEAQRLYCEALRHIDYANSEAMFSCFVDD